MIEPRWWEERQEGCRETVRWWQRRLPLGLAELKGLVGHLRRDVSRKVATWSWIWGDVGGGKDPGRSQRRVGATLRG